MKNKFTIAIILVIILFLIQDPSSAGILDRAELLFLEGDYRGTIGECKRLLDNFPRSRLKDDIHYLMGVAFLGEGIFKEARRNFETVVYRYPRSELADDAYLSLADSYFLEGNIERALLSYRKVLSKYPRSQISSQAFFGVARCHQKKGMWQEARLYFEKVRANYPLGFEAELATDILKEGLYFTVQVGSFIDFNNAKGLRDELKEKGYRAYVSEAKRSILMGSLGRKFYRVRVGRLSSKPKAEYLERKLKKEGYATRIYP